MLVNRFQYTLYTFVLQEIIDYALYTILFPE